MDIEPINFVERRFWKKLIIRLYCGATILTVVALVAFFIWRGGV